MRPLRRVVLESAVLSVGLLGVAIGYAIAAVREHGVLRTAVVGGILSVIAVAMSWRMAARNGRVSPARDLSEAPANRVVASVPRAVVRALLPAVVAGVTPLLIAKWYGEGASFFLVIMAAILLQNSLLGFISTRRLRALEIANQWRLVRESASRWRSVPEDNRLDGLYFLETSRAVPR